MKFIFPSELNCANEEYLSTYGQDLKSFAEFLYSESANEVDFLRLLFKHCGGLSEE